MSHGGTRRGTRRGTPHESDPDFYDEAFHFSAIRAGKTLIALQPERGDFKTRDDENWMKHTLAWIDDKGNTTIDYRPVHLNTLSSDVAFIPPKERKY